MVMLQLFREAELPGAQQEPLAVMPMEQLLSLYLIKLLLAVQVPALQLPMDLQSLLIPLRQQFKQQP